MVKFILVRHGLTTSNKTRRAQGHYDSQLDEIGIRQAACTAEHIANTYHIDAIYASDLSRTRDTAAPIAKLLNLPVHTDAALREVNIGDWENRLVADIEREDPENRAKFKNDIGNFRYPNGETFSETQARALDCIKRIAAAHDGETVLVVTHGGVIQVLLCAWTGTPISEIRSLKEFKNTSITVAEYEGDAVTLLSIGEVEHLPKELL